MKNFSNEWQTTIVVGFGMPTSAGHLCLERGVGGAVAAGAAGAVRPRAIGAAIAVDAKPETAQPATRTFAYARTLAWSPPV